MLKDLKHCSSNQELSEKCLSATEQVLNDEEESVLDASARVSKAFESDIAPTLSLVLPLIDSCIYKLQKNSVQMLGGDLTPVTSLHAASQAARELLLDSFVTRWDVELDREWLRTLQIATYCDPRHKDLELKHLTPAARRNFKKAAIQNARELYEMHYEKFATEKQQTVRVDCNPDADTAASEAAAAEVASELAARQRKQLLKKDYEIDVGDLLGRLDDSESDECCDDGRTEWERYEELEQTSVNDDLLAWWKQNEQLFPSIAKMAMQVHGCPACSSGVERLFSKAGRNHNKLQQRSKETSMCDILFAANCSPDFGCI